MNTLDEIRTQFNEGKSFQVERELHRQELMRERERKMVDEFKGGKANSFKGTQPTPNSQRPPPMTKRQIAVVSDFLLQSFAKMGAYRKQMCMIRYKKAIKRQCAVGKMG